MTKDANISEPSMDEILASIRQIISTDIPEIKHEDEDKGASDILDLTQLLPEENQYIRSKNPNFSSSYQGNHVLALKDPLDDSYMSQKTITETVEAFDSLRKLSKNHPQPTGKHASQEMGGQTIETLIREMLRPLLKDWLDTHLPKIVQSVVQEQVEKVMDHLDSPHSPNDARREN